MAHECPGLSPDVVGGDAWPKLYDDAYEVLAARFRPIFSRIRAGSVSRELARQLPFEEIRQLRDAGFTALRVPREAGGFGTDFPSFFALLIELSAAESNITQALRAHFGFVEHIRSEAAGERQRLWYERLSRGDLVGAGWSEIGPAKQGRFSTEVSRTEDGWQVNGEKFYTTGTLFADWVHVGASDTEGNSVSVVVPRNAPGVDVIDDWDGMGQRLTASGTTVFRGVPVDSSEILAERVPFAYSEAFYQLVHLATLAGIGRAAAQDAASVLRERKRSYSHATSPLPSSDPQLLEVIGSVRAAAYTAAAIVIQVARALDRAAQAAHAPEGPALIAEAELEIWQAQTVVTQLIIDASARLFDALGASATLRGAGLDRYWRNARTISSHNPRIYKDRIVGNFAVNGETPPGQWRIGEA